MVRFTLLEVNLDGATVTANAPFSGEKSAGAGEGTIAGQDEAAPAASGSGSSGAGLLLGVVAMVAVATVVRKLLSRGEPEETERRSTLPFASR